MSTSASAESTILSLRAGVPGGTRSSLTRLPGTDRKVVLVSVDEDVRRGALAAADSETVAGAAGLAMAQRLPLVVVLASSGADILEGVAAATPLGETPPPGGAWVVAIGSGENAYAVVDLGDSTRAADGAEPPAARGL